MFLRFGLGGLAVFLGIGLMMKREKRKKKRTRLAWPYLYLKILFVGARPRSFCVRSSRNWEAEPMKGLSFGLPPQHHRV